MTKARRKIEADIKLADLVIELLDARCPRATENPDIRRITAGKQRLILLNQADLADEVVTGKWIEHFNGQGITAIALDSRGRDSIDRIRKAAAALTKAKREKERAGGWTNEGGREKANSQGHRDRKGRAEASPCVPPRRQPRRM